jgi:transcriptional regulator with XRE-family HTH domain
MSTKIAKKRVRAVPKEASAPAVSKVRAALGLSRKLFSRLAGFSERAIAGWETGEPISDPGARRIRELERFQERLAEVIEPESIALWLVTPNDAFDALKPLEVVERGEIDRLWNMIFYVESGAGS